MLTIPNSQLETTTMKHSHQANTPLPSLQPYPVHSFPRTLNPHLPNISRPSPNDSLPRLLSPLQPLATLPRLLDPLPVDPPLLVDRDPLHPPVCSVNEIEPIHPLLVLTLQTYLVDPQPTHSLYTTSKLELKEEEEEGSTCLDKILELVQNEVHLKMF